MVPAGIKANHLFLVNHSTKTIHHHHNQESKIQMKFIIYDTCKESEIEDASLYLLNCHHFSHHCVDLMNSVKSACENFESMPDNVKKDLQ